VQYIEQASGGAPAKINLALHITGKRDDGYHTLDSLVAFADYGDSILISNRYEKDAPRITFDVRGKFAEGVPTDNRNLAWRAIEMMHHPDDPAVNVTLLKKLPHAAGIGGGSSDAAAAIREMRYLHGRPPPSEDQILSLGADVPVCMRAKTSRMRGIGEIVTPAPQLPPIWAVLLNPGVEVPTKDVFARLENPNRDGLPEMPPIWTSPGQLFAYLRRTRNDLQEPARQICRPIRDALMFFRYRSGCKFSRMSGSGATCFGLFDDPDAARHAWEKLEDSKYWVRLVRLR